MVELQECETADGTFTRVHPQHGQTYHSRLGAWSECVQVFLNPVIAHAEAKPFDEWTVLDVGFGLGLNWLCFVDHAKKHKRKLRLHSLESDAQVLRLPEPRGVRERVHPQALVLLDAVKQKLCVHDENLFAQIHLAQASESLNAFCKQNTLRCNVILQDAFSQRVNPELWDDAYFALVAKLCAPHAILVTYAATSAIQKSLRAAGFTVHKHQGFAGKRERLVAIKNAE